MKRVYPVVRNAAIGPAVFSFATSRIPGRVSLLPCKLPVFVYTGNFTIFPGEQIMPDLELTQKILDSMSELVSVMNPDQTIRWLNRAASDSAGGESPIGRHCYEVWNGRTTTCPNCPIEVTVREKRESRGTIQTRDGRYWEIRTIPILDETGNLESILEITGEISPDKDQADRDGDNQIDRELPVDDG